MLNASSSEQQRPATALVPLGADPIGGGVRATRPNASFVTQLLACAAGLPPYRPRRRAEPGEASAAYGGDAPGSAARPRLDRSL